MVADAEEGRRKRELVVEAEQEWRDRRESSVVVRHIGRAILRLSHFDDQQDCSNVKRGRARLTYGTSVRLERESYQIL